MWCVRRRTFLTSASFILLAENVLRFWRYYDILKSSKKEAVLGICNIAIETSTAIERKSVNNYEKSQRTLI